MKSLVLLSALIGFLVGWIGAGIVHIEPYRVGGIPVTDQYLRGK